MTDSFRQTTVTPLPHPSSPLPKRLPRQVPRTQTTLLRVLPSAMFLAPLLEEVELEADDTLVEEVQGVSTGMTVVLGTLDLNLQAVPRKAWKLPADLTASAWVSAKSVSWGRYLDR